jgi:hypothetical protein
MFKPTSRSPVYVRRDEETDLTASLMVYEGDGSLAISISNGSPQFVHIRVDQWRALVACIDHEIYLNT